MKYDEFHDLVKGEWLGKAKAVWKPRDLQKGKPDLPSSLPQRERVRQGKGLENKMKKDMGLK